jgi:uncharacterized protein (TIGR03067 family)
MKYRIVIILAFTLAIATLAGPPPQDTKKIQGVWVPVKAEIGGQPLKDDFLTNTVLKLRFGKYEAVVGPMIDKGAYKLNEGAKPKTIDVTGKEGPNAGRNIPCIYELRGDTLKVCYGLGDSGRPTEFKSPPGTKFFLVTYERKKP